MPDTAQVLTFSSEEERLVALDALPVEPPIRSNPDKWFREMDEKRNAILEAEIKAGAKADGQVAAAQPTVPNAGPTTTPVAVPDDELDFGKVKRSELPEILRGYKNPGEILKQAAHARDYANRLEKQFTDLSAQFEQVKAQSNEKVGNLEQEIAKIKSARDSIQSTVSSVPMSTVQRSNAQNAIDELTKKITTLEDVDENDDFIRAKSVKGAFRATAEEVTNTRVQLAEMQKQLAETRKNYEDQVKSLRSEFSAITEETKRVKVKDEFKQKQGVVLKQIEDLQRDFPELKTTKRVMPDNFDQKMGEGATVEDDVFRFTNRIALVKDGKMPVDWSERNKILNSYLNGDSELVNFCRNNGISPESLGTTENDIRSYATICNIDAHMKGAEIDPTTGRRLQVVNELNGQPVNFPSYKAAYRYILDKTGVTQAEMDRIRSEAEKRAHESLERSLAKRDTSVPTPGPQHTVSSADAGHDISEDEAKKILFMPDIAERVELSARKGDRSWFRKYNQAMKRLGMPEIEVEASWPSEKNAR